MDRLMELTEYMVKRIKSMPDKFYLILEPELVNVSFWYVPTRLRSMQHGSEREKLLGQVSKGDQSEWSYWIPINWEQCHLLKPWVNNTWAHLRKRVQQAYKYPVSADDGI